MSSNKGITLMSLAIYIVLIFVVLGILAVVTVNFQNNISNINDETSSMAEFDKFNMYFIQEVKRAGNNIKSINTNSIEFTSNNKYSYSDNSIYLNDNIKIASNIERCEFSNSIIEGKKIISVTVRIAGTNKTIEYVLNSETTNNSYNNEEDYTDNGN